MMPVRAIPTPHVLRQADTATPTPAISVNGLSFVPAGTTTSLPLIGGPDLTIATVTTTISGQVTTYTVTTTFFPSLPTSGSSFASTSSQSRLGPIIGGSVAACFALIAFIAAFFFIRARRRSTRHWRNRSDGRWFPMDGKSAANTATSAPPQIYSGNTPMSPPAKATVKLDSSLYELDSSPRSPISPFDGLSSKQPRNPFAGSRQTDSSGSLRDIPTRDEYDIDGNHLKEKSGDGPTS